MLLFIIIVHVNLIILKCFASHFLNGPEALIKKNFWEGYICRSYFFAIITYSGELRFIINSTVIISNIFYRLSVFQEMLDAAYVKYESSGEVLVQ